MNKGLFAAFAVSCAAYGAQAGDWNYTVAPDVWGPEFRTSLDMGPNPPVNGDTSIFNILKGAFLIAGEARNGRWSIGGEFNYLNLGDDVSIGPFDNAASWELEGTMTSLGAGFAVYEDEQSRLEAIAGLRHWDLDVLTTVLDRTFSTLTHWLERATVVL